MGVRVTERRQSADESREASYAVVWRVGGGPTVAGSLELAGSELRLHSTAKEDGLRIRFGDLSAIEIAREPDQQVRGNRSVVLKRRSQEPVLLATIGGGGLLIELTDLLVSLHAEQTAAERILILVPIRRGTSEQALALIEQGPPFGLLASGLERHSVFVSEREVVFLFEGEDAAALLDRLARDPALLRAAARWRGLLAGRPRLARLGFAWARLD
jgi:hypothetical protein